MANLLKTRHLFAFTSPRSIEKILPEIELLDKNFSGKVWNTKIQSEFYEVLFSSDFFMGESKAKDTALAARDRITRSPKALGFVDLKPTISLTEAGKKLVSGKRISETITKQLLKFQLPSPYHKIDRFNVKPYLEFLRLVKTVGSLSKTETALFFLQITRYDKFDEIVKKINNFREKRKINKGNWKVFVAGHFEIEVNEIFNQEIASAKFGTRESNDSSYKKFIQTKKQNMLDYADAFIRYVRATELITFQPRTFRVIVAPSKLDEVDFILDNVNNKAISFNSEKLFKEYLFSTENIKLLGDDRQLLVNKLQKLDKKIDNKLSINKLKDLLESSIEASKLDKISEISKQLRGYSEFDDIVEVFDKIQKRDVPDAPLYLEWNVWRSMVMVNDAIKVVGNFTIDTDGVPLSTAAGNRADIEIEYKSFKMIVEVTMSSGNTQYSMENESVPRHFGRTQIESDKPVFCFFIAPKISEGALAHFFNLNKMNTRLYGGKTRIIPMNLPDFINFLTTAKNANFSNSSRLYSYLNSLISQNIEMEYEDIWFDKIKNSVYSWTN